MRPLLQDYAALAWKLIAQAVVLGLAFVAHQAGAEETEWPTTETEWPAIANDDFWYHTISLHLEENQHEAEATYESRLVQYNMLDGPGQGYHSDHDVTEIQLSSNHSGPHELEISVTGPGEWYMWVFEADIDRPNALQQKTVIVGDEEGLIYREVLFPSENYGVFLLDSHQYAADTPFTMSVKLRRVDYCTMWAKVKGDLNYVTYGDVAYFNAFAQPTTVATGSMFDPEMIEMIGDMAEGMGELGLGSTADGEGSGSSGSAARRDWEDFVRQESEGGTENWGVSMVDAKTDSDFTALGTLLGGTTIEVAGPDEIHAPGGGVALTVSRLDVKPVGAIDPNSGDRIKFSWREGQPGAARMILGDIRENLLAGEIHGELYSEKTYDGRKLRITVEARFAALRGAMSCR